LCVSFDHLGQAGAKTSFIFDTVRSVLIFAFYPQDLLKFSKMLDPASWQITDAAFISEEYGLIVDEMTRLVGARFLLYFQFEFAG